MRYVIGVPAYSLKLFAENPGLFTEESGYVLDAADLAKKIIEHADRVVELLRAHADDKGLLLDYEELGMYVVSPAAIMDLHKEEEKIVFVIADKVVIEAPVDCDAFAFGVSPSNAKEE